MIHGASDEYVKPLDGRYPVLITDDDGDAHIHALVLAPVGMSLEQARQSVTTAFTEATDANPEEWNYDDITDILTKRGFNCVSVSVWEEQRDGLYGDDDIEEDDANN